MATSPYDPPKSDVGDLEAQAQPGEKPPEVRRAAAFLWSSFGVGVVNLLLDLGLTSEWRLWLVPAVTLAVMALLFACISLGQNWARIVFLLLFVVGAVPYFYGLGELFASSVLAALLSMVQVLLQAGALYLIFIKPGSLWFRR